ncbi:MAG: thiamine pyrophosphate-binding protein [Burkholderiaceae bacterium]|nr:thiamine pyrophosphate-binding protein [Burkholderiaceae bacterium]
MASAASEAIAVLEANGIDRIFGNPGTTEVPLLDATVSCGIDFHLCLHEGVAVAMADGYGRATDSVGVVMVHTSVGTANTLANLVNLRSDRSPLLVIAGDKDDRLSGRGCFCEVPDLPGLVRQVTKEAWRVTLPQKLPELVLRGLKVARAPARGPVFLAVPENYMAAELEPEFVGACRRRADDIRLRAHPDDLATIVRALAGAERPLLVAGNGIGAGESLPLLVELVERFRVPVVGEEVFTTNALNFPTDHRYYHGNFSPRMRVVEDADVVVAIGARLFMEYAWPSQPALRSGVRLLQLGADADELGKIYPAELAVLADVDDAIRGMHRIAAEVPAPDASALEYRHERALARNRPAGAVSDPADAAPSAALSSAENRMRPTRLLERMDAILPDDVVIVDESVLSKSMMQARFRLGGGRSYFGTSGGGLGWGIPAAIGVQLGMPGRRVVAFVGDGGALFNIQALWTAAHLHAPIVVVIVNNDGYMAVRRGLREFDEAAQRARRFPGTSFSGPSIDLPAIARGFGVRAVSVRSEEELTDALRASLDSSEPALIDAHVVSSHYY